MKKGILVFISLLSVIFIMVGCVAQPSSNSKDNEKNKGTDSSKSETVKKPKYVFMFIGDGMSHAQINSAQILKGNNKEGEIVTKGLNFTQFPVVGSATTYDSTSFCPDSASTATAYSTGEKTHSGFIGLKVDKKTVAPSITEQLKEDGMKIGIVTSVSIDHATPAAYYAHSESRNEYYNIATQLAKSNFDYFAGGELKQPKGKEKDKEDAYKIIENSGYKIVRTKEEIKSLNSDSGKVYAISPELQDQGAMPYAIDSKTGDLTLADFVKKGTEVLDNDKGFFLMCESGKIDWACHANDAMSAMGDVLEFENAIGEAVEFAKKHPEETLIVVTGDHETGGMTIGYATTGYNTAFNILNNQKMSYVAFDKMISKMKKSNPKINFKDIMPIITENFGLISPEDEKAKDDKNKELVLTEAEYKKLKDSFSETMKKDEERSKTEESYVLYGDYEPLSVSLTHILNNKAGIGWTSYSHTGTPVPVYAYGVGSEKFNGSYDNTDIYKKLKELCKK